MANSTEIENRPENATERQAATGQRAQAGCCGGAAPTGADACCALDAEVKATGASGCGCGPKTPSDTAAPKGCC
jgi:hypothetical protein